ncbi:MAG: hypothetical protein RTV72_15280, partial [Candidatus Thorarchaeota archaeon]
MKSRNHQSIYPGSSWLFVFILTTILFIGLGNAPIAEDNQAQIMSGGVSEEIDCNHNPAGLPHSPITIDGNQNFSDTASLEGWPGDGSQSTPYIIEGFDIGVGGPSGYCIDIRNTDVYFEIRSCFLTGASAGIYLAATSNGLLADNICSGNFYGIYNTAAHYNTM